MFLIFNYYVYKYLEYIYLIIFYDRLNCKIWPIRCYNFEWNQWCRIKKKYIYVNKKKKKKLQSEQIDVVLGISCLVHAETL